MDQRSLAVQFKELDVVVLREDIGILRAGSIGTVVAVATHPSLAYLVEFSDDQGREVAMPYLLDGQIVLAAVRHECESRKSD